MVTPRDHLPLPQPEPPLGPGTRGRVRGRVGVGLGQEPGKQGRGREGKESKRRSQAEPPAQSPGTVSTRLLNNAVLNSIKVIICCAK